MIVLILIKKIISLFLMMLLGVLLVKTKICKAEDSKVLSALSIYLIMPCMILSAFQISYSEKIRNGLLLAFFAAVVIHVFLILFTSLLSRGLHLDAVEQASVIYSNAGNLVIPLVTAMLGKDWVIYSSAFVSVQLFLLWSHGKALICGEKKPDLKKILTNVNMIAILVGILFFIFQVHLPDAVNDAVDSIGSMIAPIAMLITGMLIAGTSFRRLLSYKKIWLVTALRLFAVPLLVLLFLKYSGIASLAENGKRILLVTLLATITPSASTITQMAQVYGKDADYAGAINVVTTLLCMVTMPLMVALYQM
ncbi:MAG: AEC family transporter [Oscillospiraceae bacterium]|nr:AEC family transporter [Oscillospiraceae bacterium]MDD3262047.1 AEC family transporter [Oscillospiraceae bacterium]